MGANHPKTFRKMEKVDLVIVCDKVYQYLLLNRGRKIDELALKERSVKEKLQNGKTLYGDCIFDIASIVTLFNWIQASKIIMRNVQFLKERSIQITAAANERNSEKIAPLMKYIQNVIWSVDRLNLKVINEFIMLIRTFFGVEFIRLAKEGHGVDEELKNCFFYIEPTPEQIGNYLRQLIHRYKFTHINLEKELPQKYQKKESPPPPPPTQPQQGPNIPPSFGGPNDDQKFNYGNNNQGTGFFDNPTNMAGQKNWNAMKSGQFQHENNLNLNPVDLGKLAPSKIEDPNYNPNQPKPDNDYEDILNSIQSSTVNKEGNELVNPSMSYMNVNNKTKNHSNMNDKKDDFDDLLASLKGDLDLEKQPPQVIAPKMRDAPQRRNKAKKPIPNEPEAYKYTCEVDNDTEEKYYDDLAFEFRIEEMRRLKV